ncbi:MAG TPA: transglycosylase domain-containing protein, partial [Patescibacteria group bacterium]|nr:transglycosylase domain-containing protein [Patescibacteria group bacterium]
KYWKFLVPVLALIVGFYFFVLKDLPSPVQLASSDISQSTHIYDRNGALLYTIYSNRNQSFVPLKNIPLTVQHATIAIEDKDFYHHGAIDLRGIARAALVTLSHQEVQGGSTLTQQLVKNTLLTPERTITRKIKEVVLSFATELLYSKNQILEMYLNQIPYGGTAYGIEAAAQTYFGKHAKDLDIAESAFLAGLPEQPSVFSPFGSHPELAKQRQKQVLTAMAEQKYISQSEEQKAYTEELHFTPVSNSIKAPHFVFYIKDLLVQKYGEKMVEQGGLKVKTSLDLTTQNFAQDTVASEVAKVIPDHVTNGAAVITDPATGEILAMVGSRNYFDTQIDGNVNVTIAHRQPGSSIKPVNYADGLIHGYTAATAFVDQPICYPDPGHQSYCPQNYDLKWHGLAQMRFALGNSFNIPAVKMLKLNGVDSMLKLGSQMGISTFTNADPNQFGLSLTLGGGEVTMLDMATAYGTFANSGYRIDLHPILEVDDVKGNVLEKYTPPPSPLFGAKVLPDGVAFIISDILADNGARLAEFGPSSELHIPGHIVSVKTGTTNDFRDNWTIGYTPKYVVAVWVGNNDNTPMSNVASGITGAAPIWNKLMKKLVTDNPTGGVPRPGNVVQKPICSTTGLLPPAPGTSGGCPVRNEYFIVGTEPKQLDTATTENMWIDKTTQQPGKPGQTDNLELKSEQVFTDVTGDKYCLTCPVATPTPTH